MATHNLGGRVEVPNELVTEKNIVNFNYTWKIPDFNTLQTTQTGEKICVDFHVNNNLTMCLEVYPNGINTHFKHYLSVFLKVVSCNNRKVAGLVKFSYSHVKREKFFNIRTPLFTRDIVPDLGFADFIPNILLTGNRSIYPIYFISCEGSIIESTETPDQCYKVHTSNELGVLFENQRFSDVCLSVDGTELPAHKAILAARSPVFAAMFEHDMKEKNHNRVYITDEDQEVIRAMLMFIYTGKVENLENIADKLLVVADKYGLESLKQMCECQLCKSLSISNAVERLLLADLHNTNRLKLRATYYIVTHAIDVMDTSGWKSLIQETHLFEEVFRALAKKPDIDTINLIKNFYESG